jgi:glycosyltransferase involved in cell wall biosynthesis
MKADHPLERPPIRVLRLIARLNVGGPARHVGWVTLGLAERGFDQLLAAGRVEADEDDLGPELRAQGLTWVEIPELGRSLNPLRDLSCLAQALTLMARFRPQVIETHTSKAGTIGRAAALLYRPYARLRGWPVPKAIHTFHGHTFHGYFGPLMGRVFLTLERLLARVATWRIVVISPRQFEEICREFKVGRPEQFVVLPLGMDLAPFVDPAPGRAAFRAEMAAGEGEFLVGAVGRVAAVKNYGLYVQAASELGKARPELAARVRFLLIGGGLAPDMAALTTQAAALGLGPRFTLLGNRADPQAFQPGIDALMMTSVNEGTPIAILEAGACAKPVITTAVGGIPDMLGEAVEQRPEGFDLRQRGITVASGDAPALAHALAWVMDHPAEAAALGTRLREYVLAHHAQERLLGDLAGLYEKAVR